MKRKTYIERAARALGATPLVIPPRVLWSAARHTAIEDADATPAPTPLGRSGEDRQSSTKTDRHLSSVTAKRDRQEFLSSTEPMSAGETVLSQLRRPASVPRESAIEARSSEPVSEPVSEPAPEPEPEPAALPPVARAVPAPPPTRAPARVARTPRTALPPTAAPEGDAAAIEPLAPAPLAPAPSAQSARRAEQQRTANSAPEKPPRASQRQASQRQAPPARAASRAEAASEEVSVRIGAIDVIVEPPPRPAPPPAPLQPLARGFTSPFGLRQG